MLTLIDIGMKNATAFKLDGKISKQEMLDVLQDMRDKSERFGVVNVYQEVNSIGAIELGALAEEFRYLMDKGITNLNRIAVISDKKWLSRVVEFEDKLFPYIAVKCFSTNDKEAAVEFLNVA